LTRKEADLLALLVCRDGAVVTRQRILHDVWSSGWGPALERTLEVHIGTLRRKLGDRHLIRTVHGVGYRIDTDRATQSGVSGPRYVERALATGS
jgi:DNA-binding response OmpR family regulator